MFPEDSADETALIEHANSALYTAKRGGKNRLARYEAEMKGE